MKLISLQVFPIGQQGWQSDRLEFSDNITQVFGPNGCGKTPIVQSIAFCLGYPCVFRSDIYDRCNYVVLEVGTNKGTLKLKRVYCKGVDVEVTEPSGEKQSFYNEEDYSAYMFDLLGYKTSNLVTNSNKVTPAYMASLLPIFYLDQDEGYNKLYSPPSNFIKDQFSEMMRMIFDLPVKNSFDSKKERIDTKEKLDYLDREVEACGRKVKIAQQVTSSISKDSKELKEEILLLEADLEQLRGSGASHDDSISVLDRLVSTHRAEMQKISVEIGEISKRTRGINQIIHEINTEIESLSLNEEARRVFLSFSEVCGAANCQLFSPSSDSYSKNLLYLKDQIKDLRRNTDTDITKIKQLEDQKKNLEGIVISIIDERNKTLETSVVSSLVDTTSKIMGKIFELQNQRSNIEEVESLKLKHIDKINERNRELEKYEAFSVGGVSIPKLIKLRSKLRQLFLEWLDKLNTNNINHDITFKDDFIPVLGVETIQQLKGSTRTRAVLAFHAALIELIATQNASGLHFLILDTPKQHEIHNDDLDRYLKALKNICYKYGFQIVFSTTEYHYSGDEKDTEWNPQYQGEKQKMFLKQG